MGNPGVFRGTRFKFLISEKASYKAGVDGGYAADALAKIQSRYFRRYPVELPLDEEPSPEFTKAVDDEKPDVEQQEPDPEKLTVDEYKAEIERLRQRADLIIVRKAQIKRWMYYQYMKDQDLDPTESGALNAFRVLLLRQTGVGPSKPRHRTPIEVWRKLTANREAIAKLAKEQGANKQTGAKIRANIAKTMFEALDEATQTEFAALADQENREADENWKKNTSGPFPTTPIDRQKFIECIGPLVEPFLDILAEATGWKVSLFAGGPEPADEGRLKVFSVHSGTTKGDVPLKFPAADRARYKQVSAAFSDFLRKCYDVEECQSRALNKSEGFLPVEATYNSTNDGTMCFHYVESRESTVSPQEAHEAQTAAPAPRPSIPNALQVGPSTALDLPTSAPSAPLSSNNPVTTSTVRGVLGTDSQDGVPMMESATSTSKPSSNALNQETPPRDHDDSPTPPLTPPPHPLFDLAPSPTLLQSPPASPSKSAHITVEKSASPAAGQKRKEAPMEEHVDEGEGTISRKPAKKPKGRSKQSGDDAHSRAGRIRNRASGGTSTSATTRQDDRTLQAATPASIPTPTLPTLPVVSNSSKPSWFTSALGMMESEDLGSSWNQLVKAWAAFEAKSDFKELKKLPTTNRPDAVKAWIQRARAPAWRPTISDVTAYGLEFNTWWSALQPEWRKSSSGKIVFSEVDGDWDVLRRPGINGILSVLAGLFFWGVALREKDSREGWKDAVFDCIVVLTALCAE